jgi:transposase InsO family protein
MHGTSGRIQRNTQYTDDVDLNKKLEEWESFYNLQRPHGAFHGKTPYEGFGLS